MCVCVFSDPISNSEDEGSSDEEQEDPADYCKGSYSTTAMHGFFKDLT